MPNRPTLALVALLVALAAPVSVSSRPNDLPPGAIPPDWLRMPSPTAMQDVYPELANDLGLGGRARINCRINSHGLVESCRVASQTPPGLGFGRAALRLAPVMAFLAVVATIAARRKRALRNKQLVPETGSIQAES